MRLSSSPMKSMDLISEVKANSQEDMANISQTTDDLMCEKVLDFSYDVNNSWSVSTREDFLNCHTQ